MQVKNTIDDFLKPSNCALLVWDVQNMTFGNIFNKDEFLKQNNIIIETAHELNVPVFFSKITPLPLQFESPVRKLLMQMRNFKPNPSPDAFDLIIKPAENDIVIHKNTASIFVGTNFEIMIKNAGIRTIIIIGIATEMGVESSGRDAFNRGFLPIVASDAVSSFSKEGHERSLENMKSLFPVMPVEKIIEKWK